jgi:hypothetical protein
MERLKLLKTIKTRFYKIKMQLLISFTTEPEGSHAKFWSNEIFWHR